MVGCINRAKNVARGAEAGGHQGEVGSAGSTGRAANRHGSVSAIEAYVGRGTTAGADIDDLARQTTALGDISDITVAERWEIKPPAVRNRVSNEHCDVAHAPPVLKLCSKSA